MIAATTVLGGGVVGALIAAVAVAAGVTGVVGWGVTGEGLEGGVLSVERRVLAVLALGSEGGVAGSLALGVVGISSAAKHSLVVGHTTKRQKS